MKTLVLVFHPDLVHSRVNHKLAKILENNENVVIRYMYDIYPDGKIDAAKEQSYLLAADRIAWQFPMYWYSSPALLKQWEDDVLTYGWAYGHEGTKLHGKELLIAVSPGATAENYVHDKNFKYTVTDLLRPFQATNNLIGTRFIKPFIVTGASSIDDATLEQKTKEYLQYITTDHLEDLADYE